CVCSKGRAIVDFKMGILSSSTSDNHAIYATLHYKLEHSIEGHEVGISNGINRRDKCGKNAGDRKLHNTRRVLRLAQGINMTALSSIHSGSYLLAGPGSQIVASIWRSCSGESLK